MVWLLLSWLAVGVVAAVGFGALAHRAEAAGDPLTAAGRTPSPEAVEFAVSETTDRDDRAAA